nr:HAD family hydrolase [uncultured Sellimonas sp.]
MYKACIFDLDGTLTDTLDSMTYSVNLTLERMNLPKITREQCRSFVGNGARVLMELTLKACGDDKLKRIDEAMQVYSEVFAKYCTYHVKPYDGILEMLKELKDMGVSLAVLSNKPDMQAVDVVGTFFGDGQFQYVQGQKEGIPRKPDPAGVYEILRTLGIKKEECLYIGDSDVDIHTGRNAAIKTIGVSWGFRTREILKEAGADAIIDRPQQLVSIVKGEKEKKNERV